MVRAKDLTFKVIDRASAIAFVIKWHYKHKPGAAGWYYGAFYNNELVGVCTFGKPASPKPTEGVLGKERKQDVWELNRLVLLDAMPKNSESRFVGWCLRQLPKNTIIISYADTAYGHTGIIYHASNFIYTGLTKPRTDAVVEGKHPRHIEKGTVTRQARSAKHRFVYCTNRKDIPLIRW